jgi:glycosyltransferase involved in cell wall biosynthesis
MKIYNLYKILNSKVKSQVLSYFSGLKRSEIPKGKLKRFAKRHGLLNRTNKSDTITLIIPCFKHAIYLKKCLESIINQTVMPNKIVIINDASPDHTSEIVTEFIHLYPHLDILYIVNEENQGQAACINRGVSETNTDLYMILNDDDYLLPSTIEIQLEIFRQNPFIHLCGTTCYVIKNDQQIDSIVSNYQPPKVKIFINTPHNCWLYKNYNDLNMTHTSCTFSRIAWEHVGGYLSNKTKRIVPFSDRDFQLRVNACCLVATGIFTKLSCWREGSSVDRELNS